MNNKMAQALFCFYKPRITEFSKLVIPKLFTFKQVFHGVVGFGTAFVLKAVVPQTNLISLNNLLIPILTFPNIFHLRFLDVGYYFLLLLE